MKANNTIKILFKIVGIEKLDKIDIGISPLPIVFISDTEALINL